ncbi:UDP pyrophosphate synthetase [Salinisphaera dokdonensis CL-ES53]|uniref:UDP pyrophosphate synthetase n=2 Tax=Salinisphaera TaxID=180541 RepID=A0ABV2B393_9GAMM
MGVKTLTLFAFSSENWQRPRAEVRLLLDLFRRTIRREIDSMHANGVRLSFIGERSHFSDALRREMSKAEEKTLGNDALSLVIAIDYGGRWDIVEATRRIARECAAGTLSTDEIDESHVGRHMALSQFGAPDLFIRTGGERRVSNFLLWDLAYSELYFSDELWPDFNDESLANAIEWFAQRQRRFGRLPQAVAPGG